MKMPKRTILITVSTFIVIATITTGAYAFNKQSTPKTAVTTVKSEVSKEIASVPAESAPVEEVTTPGTSVSTDEPTKDTGITESTTEKASNGNLYAEGSNSWYIYNRRIDTGKTMGVWGNPIGWKVLASKAGSVVDLIPEKDAIALEFIGDSLIANMGIVESVNGNEFSYSMMADNQVSTLSSGLVSARGGQFVFIH